jgi:hypothetical protein
MIAFHLKKYCAEWNKYKAKQLQKRDKKLNEFLASVPRKHAPNYETDFTGKQYESLHIESCCNDHLEGDLFSYCLEHPNKKPKSITVYKQYKCKCTICGKEQYITCDKFGIYPPTKYGYRAYHGYWSNVFCDCHPISSFQWIICKLLFEANVKYRVEVTFPDLYGIGHKNLLRFDFALLDDHGNIKELLECQGEQHYEPVSEFGGINQFNKQKENDEFKRQYAATHNIPLHELSYKYKSYEKANQFLHRIGWL